MRKGAVLKLGLVVLVAGLAVYAGSRTWSSQPVKPAEIVPPQTETAAPAVYRISGTILDHNNSPLSGVGVVFNFRGGLFGKTTTNENGHYSQEGFSSGAYTLTASRPGFAAQSQTVVVTGADTAADFQLKALVYSVSGTATTPDGSAIPEAMVTLDDPAGSSTATDGEGRYYFADLTPRAYVLAVSKPGSVAETKRIDIIDADISVDVMLQPVICSVSGTVTASDGTPLGLAKIEFNGSKYLETAADNKGYYFAGGLPSGTYVITASKDGYVSEAKTIDIMDPTVAVDFALAVPTRTMWGVVTASDGTALAGVAIEINGPVWNQTTTRNTGDYHVEALLPGAYTVTASKPGYMEQTRTMEISTQDAGCDFVLPVRTYTISGIAATADGAPVPEVKLEFNGPVWAEVATDYSGRYSKGELPPGTYTVTTTRAGFVPKSQTVVIADLDVALDVVLNVLEVQ